jgi:hypothetical protein
MYRTYSIRTIHNRTRDFPRQRRTEEVRKAFAFLVRKENILPATAIRKRTFIVSLKERTV